VGALIVKGFNFIHNRHTMGGKKHIYAFIDFLGKLLFKCLENPETFVEIPQKLEVSNRTIRRSQVFLHFWRNTAQ
jgi:hypothetical protein